MWSFSPLNSSTVPFETAGKTFNTSSGTIAGCSFLEVRLLITVCGGEILPPPPSPTCFRVICVDVTDLSLRGRWLLLGQAAAARRETALLRCQIKADGYMEAVLREAGVCFLLDDISVVCGGFQSPSDFNRYPPSDSWISKKKTERNFEPGCVYLTV